MSGTARVLCRALGRALPQPTVRAQARPPGRAGRPGLAPWRPQRLTPGALLGARGWAGLWPAGQGAAPAAGRHAHAALSPLLAVRLALRPLVRSGAGAAGLGRDGAEQVVPGAQEVALARQAEAALAQRHAGGRVAGWPRPVVVLELGQVGRVAVGDELRVRAAESTAVRGRGSGLARQSPGGAPGAARQEAAQIPEADPHVPDRARHPDAERRAAARAIRRKTADPERIRSITRTTRTSPAGTRQDDSSVPRKKKMFLLRSRSKQSLFPRRFPSAILQSACICRPPRSLRNSSCRAR